jgi:hypothetical protein
MTLVGLRNSCEKTALGRAKRLCELRGGWPSFFMQRILTILCMPFKDRASGVTHVIDEAMQGKAIREGGGVARKIDHG